MGIARTRIAQFQSLWITVLQAIPFDTLDKGEVRSQFTLSDLKASQ